MVLTILVNLLAAAGSGGAGSDEAPARVAVVSLSGVGVSADALAFDGEHLAQSLRAPGLKVITSRELGTLLGMERERALMGCDSEATSCIAELAAALGAEVVVVGDVGSFEGQYQVNVKALSGQDARLIAARSSRVGDAVGVLDALTAIGRALAVAILNERRLPVPVELTRMPGGTRPLGWIPLGIGGAVGAAGGVLLGLARSDAAALTGTGPQLTVAAADALRDSGRTKQMFGVGLLVASGAALLTAAGFFLFGRDPVALTLAPTPDGWSLALAGWLP